jgi:HSP20 family protein
MRTAIAKTLKPSARVNPCRMLASGSQMATRQGSDVRRRNTGASHANPVDSLFRELEMLPERVFGRGFVDFPRFDRDVFPTSLTSGTAMPFEMMERGTMEMRMDMTETDKDYKLMVDIPGVPKENVKLSISNKGVLSITAERKTEEKSGGEKENFVFYERTYGHAHRSIQLPEDVDAQAIEAKHDHGVLTISIPKKETHKGEPIRDININ